MVVELKRSESATAVDDPRRREPVARNSENASAGHCQPGTPNALLISRCLDEEFGAWNELVTRYERLVYAIPLREGLSPDDAAEISQAVFETLVQSLHRIQQPERLGHWLMTVARRLSWRRRNQQRMEVSVDVHAAEPTADDRQWEHTVEIYDAILELGDPCRSLIFGLFFDPAEPSYDELGRSLGFAVGSIGPLRARCLSRLRSILEEDAA